MCCGRPAKKATMFGKVLEMMAMMAVVVSLARTTTATPPDSPPPHDTEQKDHRLWNQCRRDPTWRRLGNNPDDCQRVMGWKPRDRWWKHDPENTAEWLGHNATVLTQCLQEALEHGSHSGIPEET